MPVRARTDPVPSRLSPHRSFVPECGTKVDLGYPLLVLFQQRQRVSSRTELVATLFANHYHDRLFATADIVQGTVQ